MIPVTRLNHAVLYVRDAEVAANFYMNAFDFEPVGEITTRAAFLRARQGDNHHDLGLFGVGPDAAPIEARRIGLYHLAWQVPTIEDLAAARTHLLELGSLAGESDHSVSKSLYARDPDGNEFEIMYQIPREQWADYDAQGGVARLDLDAELARYGTGAQK
ncbi:MAG: VOC family protein [Acidimicrobiia bacterium]